MIAPADDKPFQVIAKKAVGASHRTGAYKLRTALEEHVSDKQFHRLVRLVYKMAERGDKWALELMFKYRCPIPGRWEGEDKPETPAGMRKYRTLADLMAPYIGLRPLALPPGVPQPVLREDVTNG
jgi:hypothetical protein